MTEPHQDPPVRVDEIDDGIFRLSTAVALPDGGAFTFNQFVIRDEQPLLYHTGPRKLFPVTRRAIEQVLPLKKLRFVAFSHFEADECGALNEILAAAPAAEPLCGAIAAMVSVEDYAARPPRAMADGEEISLGRRQIRWFATPHLPHAWECGHLFESTSRTLFCGDLFTQGGAHSPAVTTGDILDASERFRAPLDYFAHARDTRPMIHRLAALQPRLLACMHGSSWRGDAAELLRALAERVEAR